MSIGAVLAHLLLTAVEGTDVGVDIGDLLAVEDRLAVEHAVGPGSCGPILMNIVSGWSGTSVFRSIGLACSRSGTTCGSPWS